jgi:hypothetical protein
VHVDPRQAALELRHLSFGLSPIVDDEGRREWISLHKIGQLLLLGRRELAWVHPSQEVHAVTARCIESEGGLQSFTGLHF